MKTILTKYCVLLFLVLCISGCRNPFEPLNPEMGYLSLAIEEASAGRTILPNTPTAGDFAVFTLWLFNLETNTALDPIDRTNKNLFAPINLDAGTYRLLINAYKDTEKNQLAAQGNLSGIVINPGVGNSYTVILRPFIDEGEGTFRWNIDFPEGMILSSMTISPLNPATGTSEKTWYFTGGTPLIGKEASINLKSGYYRVIFTLSKEAMQQIERREILHIYQNTESFFSFVFTEEYFNNISYTVTFVYNDEINESGQQTCTHGNMASNPGNPNRSGYIFLNWYSDAALTEIYDFNTPIIGDITLYAKWQGSFSGTATIEGTYKIGEELSIITSGITGANAPFIYQWKADGDDISVATDETYVIQGSDAGKAISCVITHDIAPGSITATGEIVPYTIKFDITELTDDDSISFAEDDSVIETYGYADDIITIYYLLAGGHHTDWLMLTFTNLAQKMIATPGSSHLSYTVAAEDAVNGVITIAAASEHTDLIVLDAPTSVGLTKNGVISFTAGANNAAAGNMSYTYTVYKDGTAIGTYTEHPITNSGTTVSGLVGEMLTSTGAYTVKVTAHTANTAYTASSIQSVASIAVYVYSVTVSITGASGMDKITVNMTDHTVNFVVHVFGGDTVTLTAVPDAGRKMTWSGAGTDTQMTRTINDINTNAAITVTFAAKVAQTITASTYNTTSPLIGETIISTDGTYTAHDGGNAGTHIYQWKRSDNSDRTGNVTQLAENKNYTPTGTDFGKYIWLETTPVGSENMIGTAAQGAVLRVGVKLITTVTGAGGGSATVNNTNGATGVIIYGQANITVNRNISTNIVVWSVNEGTVGDTTAISTTYTPPPAPSMGTITLTATLTAVPDGTENNPFLVATVQDLQHVGKPESGTGYANWTRTMNYRQIAHIDMNGQTFTAIGTENAPFIGSFDGQGYTIKNLTINDGLNSYQGLFGYIGSRSAGGGAGRVRNVGLINSSITSTRWYVGGIVGYIEIGSVENCYNTGNVTGNGYVGGVVGYNQTNGSVRNCYTTGSVTGTDSNIGGVVGLNYGTVENCYATGNVTGNSYVGGIVGEHGSSNFSMRNCVALNMSIKGSTSGRVVGRNSSSLPAAAALRNNHAWVRMTVNGAIKNSSAGNSTDGIDLTLANTKLSTWWTTASPNGPEFTFNTNWKWTTDKMPHLFDDDLWDWPSHISDQGTESNPFYVESVQDLQHVGKPEAGTKYAGWILAAYYKQTANIDLDGTGNWTPIGNGSNDSFTGTFDGQGYTINNLTITSGSDYQGLFGYIGSGGTVKNVGLVGGSITGRSYIGGIAGNNNGTVQNCYNTGNVTGSSNYVGGVVAYNIGGTVGDCYVTGNVTGSSSNIGGVVGCNISSGTVKNCYATGSVTGSSYVGGVVGTYSSGTVQNCVALNERVRATSNTTYIGRVVGNVSSFTNNYAWERMTVTTGGTYTPNKTVTGKDGADFVVLTAKTQAVWGNASGDTGANFNFTAPWKWTNDKMPHLFIDDLWDWPAYINDFGMESNPFLVATVEDLQHVGKPEAGTQYTFWTLDVYYKQIADIDLTGTGNWTPIGDSSTRFTGTFDGQGYTINNLTITSGSDRGLFGYIGSGGTVKNVGLVGGSITGGSSVGGIAGNNYGTVQNCYNTGSISGSAFIGGVVGLHYAGTVQNCYATGNVTGSSNNVGGVVGTINTGTVQNCYATGNVTNGSTNIGGVVGRIESTGTVKNCVALNSSVRTSISAPTSIGHVVGSNYAGDMINNYAKDGMTITYGSSNTQVIVTGSANNQYGAPVSAADYNGPNSGTWWRDTVLFPDTAWNFAANALPTLKH